MEMNQKLMKPLDWKCIFKSWPGLFFILDDNLCVIMVSSDFIEATKIDEERLIGRSISEIYNFYSTSYDKDDLRWRLSLEYVRQSGEQHKMKPVKFDIDFAGDEVKNFFLRPIQIPVFDENNDLLYIIHRLESIDPWGLKDNENERLTLVSELVNDGIYEIDFRTERVWWNDQLYNILGYEIGEVHFDLAQMLRIIHHEDRRRVFDLIRSRENPRSSFEVEYRLKRKDNVYIDVLSSVVILRDAAELPVKFLAAIHDISHYKEQIRLKSRLELVTSTVPAMICYIDKNLRYQFLNNAYKTIYNEGLNELIDQPVIKFLNDESVKRFLRSAERVLNGNRVEMEYSSSRDEYFKTWYIPDYDEEGTVQGFIGLTMDITKEKHREIALNSATQEKQRLLDELSMAHEQINKEKEILKEFFMEAPALIAIFEGPDFVLKYLNDKALQVYRDKVKIGQTFKAMVPANLSMQVKGILEEVYHTQKEYRAIEFEVKADPSTFSVQASHEFQERYFDFVVQATKNLRGESVGVILYANEVTGQVLAKRAIEEGAKRDRMMLEAMPIIAYSYNVHGKLEYLNSKWYDYTGDQRNSAIGASLREYLHPDDLTKSSQAWKHSLLQGTIYNEYVRIRNADGKFKWHYTRVVPVRSEGGKIFRWIGTSTDIDEQIKANERKDQFISIASHELKTPLTSVMAYIQLAGDALTEEHAAKELINRAYKNSEKLSNLISELLDISRIQSGKMTFTSQPFELDKMVQEVVENHQHSSKSHKIELSGESNVIINGDQSRLERVLHNLLSNAIKYSPGESLVSVLISKTEAGMVSISVTDYGLGISEKDKKHLFAQFYRSEKVAKGIGGLGIGLYISLEIVRLHGGNISVDSHEGEFSTFTIELPF